MKTEPFAPPQRGPWSREGPQPAAGEDLRPQFNCREWNLSHGPG